MVSHPDRPPTAPTLTAPRWVGYLIGQFLGRGAGDTMAYYTNCGPESGAIRLRTVPSAIGVLKDPGDGMPIGMAMVAGTTTRGFAVWRLTVRGVEVPGLWDVVNREFRRTI